MVLEHDVSLGNADSWGLMLVFHKHPQPSSTTAPRKFPSWVSLSTEPLPRLCEKIYGGWPDALKSDFNADRHHGQFTTSGAVTNSETLRSRLQAIWKQSATKPALKSLSFCLSSHPL